MLGIIEITEGFSFPDLSASATLVRVRSESPVHRIDYPIVGRTQRGLPVYGMPVVEESVFDVNALIMQRDRGSLRDLLQGRPAVVEDVTHLSGIPDDDAARLVAVREEVEALIRFSNQNPDWPGVGNSDSGV